MVAGWPAIATCSHTAGEGLFLSSPRLSHGMHQEIVTDKVDQRAVVSCCKTPIVVLQLLAPTRQQLTGNL